jgi:hypothetical protein
VRTSIIFISSVVAFGLFASGASALTTLTRDQVNAVCGKDLKTENGHSGCTKKCTNGDTCIYSCSNTTGNCSGHSLPKSKARGVGTTTRPDSIKPDGKAAPE